MAIEYLFTSDREPGHCDAYHPHAQAEKRCIFEKGDFKNFCKECTDKTDTPIPVYESYLKSINGALADTILLKYTKKRWEELLAKLKSVTEDIKYEDFDYDVVRGKLGQVMRALRFGIDDPDYEDIKYEEEPVEESVSNEDFYDTENFDIWE